MMLTTDLALKLDPTYAPIAKRFHENLDELAGAFGKAWFKLLHRDMGPISRYLGPWVPEPQLWQDPVPAVDHKLMEAEIADLKAKILESGMPCLTASRSVKNNPKSMMPITRRTRTGTTRANSTAAAPRSSRPCLRTVNPLSRHSSGPP